MSPFVTVGSRTNLNFGDRFGYRYDQAEENDLFTAIAQFGQGLLIVMMVADGESANELDEGDWIPISAIFN